ncbi:MAG TPA: transketolase [Candidatus Onthovicinus excrementipullorum]|nr:transketolase [Candidatus Onthovicinus excrementipullorum]
MSDAKVRQLEIMACKARMGVIEGTFNAKSGHPGGSLSAVDILTCLYFSKMNVDPQNPKDPNRDRLVLSKGHAAPALYAVLALKGYFPFDELKTLRKSDARLQGHPSMCMLPGLDMSTGSLGQGISAAAGMALAGKLDHKDYKVYAILGDGECEEGQVWEAAMFAAHKELDNLVAFVDFNNLQIDGTLDEVNAPTPLPEKFTAFGWDVMEIDGNNIPEILEALDRVTANGKPTAIIAKTVKGKGVSYMENVCGWHGKAPNKEEYDIAMAELNDELGRLGGK